MIFIVKLTLKKVRSDFVNYIYMYLHVYIRYMYIRVYMYICYVHNLGEVTFFKKHK